ncbi:protein HtrL-like [Ostrea edulis]|uniref:protein HtrL-like n=1 Tax=Ostrea edulis TaxID=37623 RepID=UPI0024AF96E6|nr:protein HtrL-like [Ostrea edulis]
MHHERTNTGALRIMKVWNLTALLSRIRNARRQVRCKMQKYVSTNFTIVTAYWNLGTFRKGKSLTYSKTLYMKWAASFQYMLNPLVVYTDSTEFRDLMQAYRNDLLCNTKIIYMNRTDIYAFRKIDEIKSVYKQPGYPKYYPNTVSPEYTAAQHAKFTVVADTYKRKLFTTRYYAWIDVGYFRDIANIQDYYVMVVPPDMDPKRLAYNFAKQHVRTADPITVFRNNLVWVGGGMFIGLGEVIDRFERFYQKAVDYFMNSKVMNSDQQVLYSIYTHKGRKALNPPVELQLYVPKLPHNSWFYLGFLCRKVIKGLHPVKIQTLCITASGN